MNAISGSALPWTCQSLVRFTFVIIFSRSFTLPADGFLRCDAHRHVNDVRVGEFTCFLIPSDPELTSSNCRMRQ